MKFGDLSKRIPLRKNGALNAALIDDILLSELAMAVGIAPSKSAKAQICFHVVHNISYPVTCECGVQRKFKGFGKGYAASCGNNKCRQDSYKKEMLTRYGVANSWQKAGVKDKIKATTQLRYGVEHVMQNSDIVKKARSTNRERYGVDWVMQSPAKIELRQQNNLQKYGVREPIQLRDVQERLAQTNTQRRGVPWPAQAEGNRQLSNATRKKSEDLRRPGRLAFGSEHACLTLYQETPNLAYLAKKFDVGHLWLSRTFRKFGITLSANNISSVHREVMSFLTSLGIEYLCNDRTAIYPLELDILIPGKMAIEIDGIYWHTFDEVETPKQKQRHLEKLQKCEDAGIQLMRFTDVEWHQHKHIIMSMIKSRLGIFERRIFARNTEVAVVEKTETQNFLSENHLLGKCGASHSLGLRHNGELVAIATFGKSRFLKSADTELLRFCCAKGVQVVGALGKLLKHAQEMSIFKILVSYSTRDKFEGKLYQALGFTLQKISGPGYYYWHRHHGVVSRNNLQKHKLVKLPEYNSELTEAQICFNAGFRRYWNCGTKTWILQNEI